MLVFEAFFFEISDLVFEAKKTFVLHFSCERVFVIKTESSMSMSNFFSSYSDTVMCVSQEGMYLNVYIFFFFGFIRMSVVAYLSKAAIASTLMGSISFLTDSEKDFCRF